ncbi:hypothetical protein J7K76_02750 [Candidatus Bipolaricaulota bacterium]|nr:hypothetical protein [Candidatus Bipolaricaulota bacterium]RLE32315.1 MAG: hypothetical protein DRJ58_05520 [Candidatus Acetothermia bacterium]
MPTLERRLEQRAWRALRELRGLRGPRTEDIFERRQVLGPDDFEVENYPRRKPLAAFNPGAVLVGRTVYIFPRLVFDYYSYTSSIGVVSLGIEELLSGEFARPLRARIVLWPQTRWEAVKGCEDPRVTFADGHFRVLYTGVGKPEDAEEMPTGTRYKAVLGYAELDPSLNVTRKGYFCVHGGEERLVPGNKDSALIQLNGRRATLLTRPSFRSARLRLSSRGPFRREKLPDMCWRAEADLEEFTIPADSLRPVLSPEAWEYKIGWSTNTVRVGEDEYLVGWHGVLREDLSYRNGLALVDGGGNLRAVSDYVLAPRGLPEEYGDRSLTIFGNGLVVYKDLLVWIGGISDYGIGVFVTELSEAFRVLRRI